ncbi:hypothetical protein VE03_08690 [Pseudogymnoascus sp. 23342-1-I1]|nr:hypothetical protein VE03_08690 [Pseudogymnoascus sp. 23342-1-I1]
MNIDISVRDEMREILDDWAAWAPPGENRIQSWLNTAWGITTFIALFLLAVGIKCYMIADYLLGYIWPWSSRNKKLRAERRKENEFKQLVRQASHNTDLVVSRQVQDQDITGKNGNFLFHRIPFEVRRQILVLAFGDQTVHMDLQFRYPLDLADKECSYRDLHARINYCSIGTAEEQRRVFAKYKSAATWKETQLSLEVLL